MEHMVFPLIGFDDVRFGESRDRVRKAIEFRFGIQHKEYRKGRDYQVTDAYDCFHVYYDCEDRCEAVEFFNDARVILNGRLVFPCNYEEVSLLMPELEKDDLGWVSIEHSIGIYAPNERVESILFGKPCYFSDDTI